MTVPTRESLNGNLFRSLEILSTRQVADLQSPVNCPKRASVAVILAFRAVSPHTVSEEFIETPSNSFVQIQLPGTSTSISQFESIEQLKSLPAALESHILFIRRASRKGDRWSSHVALPGGKREPDESDIDASVRETMEEVGIDISTAHALFIGSLGHRPVTTSFGSHYLMTLCPYVFVLKLIGLPDLKIQESEVANAHWVPLTNLLDPTARAKEVVDLSARLVGFDTVLRRSIMRTFCGSMYFSAIELKPTVTTISRPNVPELSEKHDTHIAKEQRLLLWGLTLGVMIDFLDIIQINEITSSRDIWQLPSFSAIDLNSILWLLTLPRRVRLPHVLALSTGASSQRQADGDRRQTSATEVVDYTGTAHQEYVKLIKPAIALTIGFRISTLIIVAVWTKRLIYK